MQASLLVFTWLSTSANVVVHAGKFLSNAIREADANQDGQVSLEEFIKYYERLAR